MSSRYVRILAIKRTGGKTTLYHPSSPRRDPHDVTPQNYPQTGERFTGLNTSALLTALVAIASKTAANWGKVPRVYSTPPHFSPPTGYLSLLVVWVRVGGFQNSCPFVPLRQNGIIIILPRYWVPLPAQMIGQHPGLPNTIG